jgi:hypothetical protein
MIVLSACSKYNYPDDVYYSEQGHPKYEYPEYQNNWPLFPYFLPTYPQFYVPYYYMPYYRINPPSNPIPRNRSNNPDPKQNKPSTPIRKFGNSN